jgi:DNA-binding XRE family transcriptional regulator
MTTGGTSEFPAELDYDPENTPAWVADATDAAYYLGNLRKLRRHCLLSQNDLSALSGVSRQTIIHLEGMRRPARLDTMRRLARTLRVQPGDLL